MLCIARNNGPRLFEMAHCMPTINALVAVNTTPMMVTTSRRGNRAETTRPGAAAFSE